MKYLGLDLGTKTLGLAITDALGIISSPYKVIRYENIDLLLCTYDYRIDNVRYAEPNKLYESMYFRKPIIVSSSTFLSKKVAQLGIGYDIDSLNRDSIITFIQNLTPESIESKVKACSSIPQEECIINDQTLFVRIQNI